MHLIQFRKLLIQLKDVINICVFMCWIVGMARVKRV